MSESESASNQGKTPDWAIQPFRDYLDVFARLSQVLSLSREGIHELSSAPRLIEVTAKFTGKSNTEQHKRRLKEAEEKAEQAKREIDDDF